MVCRKQVSVDRITASANIIWAEVFGAIVRHEWLVLPVFDVQSFENTVIYC
jgi:hypothetical protein